VGGHLKRAEAEMGSVGKKKGRGKYDKVGNGERRMRKVGDIKMGENEVTQEF